MKRLILSMLFFFLTLSAAAQALAEVSNPALRAELLKMQEADQKARNEASNADIEAMDAMHRARLKEIVAQSGWPKISAVGRDGAFAAWLIAQHADGDRAFQLQVVELLGPLVRSGEAAPQSLAYLHDRTHQPQRYGTQGQCNADGQWAPREIEDRVHLDERRTAVGLPAFEEYARAASENLCSRQPSSDQGSGMSR